MKHVKLFEGFLNEAAAEVSIDFIYSELIGLIEKNKNTELMSQDLSPTENKGDSFVINLRGDIKIKGEEEDWSATIEGTAKEEGIEVRVTRGVAGATDSFKKNPIFVVFNYDGSVFYDRFKRDLEVSPKKFKTYLRPILKRIMDEYKYIFKNF